MAFVQKDFMSEHKMPRCCTHSGLSGSEKKRGLEETVDEIVRKR